MSKAEVSRHTLFTVLLLSFALPGLAQSPLAPPLPSGRESPPRQAQPKPPNRSLIDPDPSKDLEPSLRRFVNVLSKLQSEGAGDNSIDKLIYEGAIPSMLRQLDPHTQFFDPSQFEQLRQMEESEQKGFGSVVSVLPGQVIFLQTLPGSPSNKAGIQAGDELVAINNIAIQSLEAQQIVELLTEAKQQKISVFIRRQGSARILQFALFPELVGSPSVDRAFLLQPGVGYIRIASWDLQTAKQLHDSLEILGGNKLSGLILDLRNNPGGVVKAALDAAAMFLKPGQQILTAKGRATEPEIADVPKTAKPYDFRLAVLINEKTASASEILSGALQDHDRAVIVGEASYGKGLVQSVMSLSGGAGLAITTAFYYTPSGRSIQRPLNNSALSEIFSSSAKLPAYKTDSGRLVTGGGGIHPDLQISPAPFTRLEAVLDASGSVTSFATQYLAKHPLPPGAFNISTDILDDFKVFLSGRQIQPSVAEWSQEQSWIRIRLEEEIVTQARGVDKGDEIQTRHDLQVQAALKAIQENSKVAPRA